MLRIQKLRPSAKLSERASDGAACLDLFADVGARVHHHATHMNSGWNGWRAQTSQRSGTTPFMVIGSIAM